jgi:hypothetical protein
LIHETLEPLHLLGAVRCPFEGLGNKITHELCSISERFSLHVSNLVTSFKSDIYKIV